MNTACCPPLPTQMYSQTPIDLPKIPALPPTGCVSWASPKPADLQHPGMQGGTPRSQQNC